MIFLLYPSKYQLDHNILLETTSKLKMIFLLLQTAIIDKKKHKIPLFCSESKITPTSDYSRVIRKYKLFIFNYIIIM
jgi:hypothetical protein